MQRLAAIMVGITLCACADPGLSETPPPGSRFDGGLGCARPAEGCECEPGSGPIDCYEPAKRTESEMVCAVGTRTCREGRWSACESIQTTTFRLSATALIDGPSECNPCDPACAVSRDYPDAADLTAANSDQVEYRPADNGIGIQPPNFSGSTLPDRDGDGVPDASDEYPDDPTRAGRGTDDGGFFHVLPFNDPPVTDELLFTARVTSADVYFLMDTTGSMGAEISNLRSGLTSGTFYPSCPGGVVEAIRCIIPDTWFGVGRFDDYPVTPNGGSSDVVFENLLDLTDDVMQAQSAMNTLFASGGYDWPESNTQALWAVATGGGLGPYLSAKGACANGGFGYPCYRPDSIPLIVHVTDAPYHNGPTSSYDYTGFEPPPDSTTAVSGNDDAATAYAAGDLTNRWSEFTGNTCGLANDVDSPSCYSQFAPDSFIEFQVTTRKQITISIDPFPGAVISLWDAALNPLGCQYNSWGPIQQTLDPGTYYAAVDGLGYEWTDSTGATQRTTYCGNYALRVGDPASAPVTFTPVTYAESVQALRDAGIRVLTIESSGMATTSQPYQNAVSLSNNTGSLDSSGQPLVFQIPGDGTGIAQRVVDAVDSFVKTVNLEVEVRPVDNLDTTVDERGFIDAINAVAVNSGSCTSTSGSVFQGCSPGTEVRFEVVFRNDIVAPTIDPQIFDFSLQVLLDGGVQQIVPVRVVVPPLPRYPDPGRYWRTYDSTAHCTVPPERPDWGMLTWTASTPSDTSIDFEIRTAGDLASLGSATPTLVTVPGDVAPIDVGALLFASGEQNLLPYLRVTAVLRGSSDELETPILTGFELTYTCLDFE